MNFTQIGVSYLGIFVHTMSCLIENGIQYVVTFVLIVVRFGLHQFLATSQCFSRYEAGLLQCRLIFANVQQILFG